MSVVLLFTYTLNEKNILTSKKQFNEIVNGKDILSIIYTEINNNKSLSNTKLSRVFYFDSDFEQNIDLTDDILFNERQKITVTLTVLFNIYYFFSCFF